jgi:outer membrane protein TolC
VAEASYQEGLITILELNTAYNELTRAKAAYLQALYNYNIAVAELEKITGVDSMRTAPDTGKYVRRFPR